jgi:hypothetical protein
MSLNEAIAPSDLPTESFSAILERLTQRANAKGILLGDEVTSKPASSNVARTARRYLAPLSQTKSGQGISSSGSSGRGNSISEGMSLSYESALRAHSRYRPAVEPFKTPALAPVPDVSVHDTTSTDAIRVAPFQNSEPATRNQIRRTHGTKSSGTGIEGGKEMQISSPAIDYAYENVLGGARSRSNALSLDRKHATMSVRLSRQDSDRLRMRAAESGMTVSAYMRSCVLEAEQLRAQVKLALAELRARTQEIEPMRLSVSKESRKGRSLLQLLTRPVTFFLGPRLPLRRSA